MTNGNREKTEDELTEAEKKRRDNQETGCAIIFLAILVVAAIISIAFTIGISVAIARHNPNVPWIQIIR